MTRKRNYLDDLNYDSKSNIKIRKKKEKRQKNFIKVSVILNIILIAVVVFLAVLDRTEYVNVYAESDSDSDSDSDDDSSDSDTEDGYIVCIDAGHGGSDVGTEGIDGDYEKDDNLALALLVQEELEDLGVTVVMTRTTDVYLSTSERAEIANDAGADLFVALHRNYYEEDESICGIEAWISSTEPDDAVAAATTILDMLENTTTITDNRGVKSGTQEDSSSDYAVNSQTEMTSMILEMGFMSNEEDNYDFDEYMDEYASAIAEGILDWLEENVDE